MKLVYGKSFNLKAIGSEKIRQNVLEGGLIQLALRENRKRNFAEDKIISGFESFFMIVKDMVKQSRQEILILFSNYSVFSQYKALLEYIRHDFSSNVSDFPIIRILIPKNKRAELLGRELTKIKNVEVNCISESDDSLLCIVVDKKCILFSQIIQKSDKISSDDILYTVSVNDSKIWYNISIFEGLWKQSILENKVEKLYAELEHNSVTSNNFMRIMAHELKSPIQPIIGFSEIIQNNNRLDPSQKNELLKIISRNARKLDILTNNILDFARLENKIFELSLQKFDIVELVEELISDYKLQTSKRDIVLNYTSSNKPLFVNADRLRIMEVIDNLISNSIKFTESGYINIVTKLTDKKLVIKVTDSGDGIQKELVDKIFDKFFTTDKHGTGLGLYIAKIIVERHGGIIYAKNNSKKGCTFVIEMPV
ncbi:MAG: HAMP domain-containing histidine kinase [Thermoproteota archaeon]|nr:HAMP domain-containing histidine kinase [Thermoproteota archaeon]